MVDKDIKDVKHCLECIKIQLTNPQPPSPVLIPNPESRISKRSGDPGAPGPSAGVGSLCFSISALPVRLPEKRARL